MSIVFYLDFLIFIILWIALVLVLVKARKTLAVWMGAFIIGAANVWVFQNILFTNPLVTQQMARVIFDTVSLFVFLEDPLSLVFILLITERQRILKSKFFYLIFLFPIFLFYKQLSNQFIVNIQSTPFGWTPVPPLNILTTIFTVVGLTYLLINFYLLVSFRFKTNNPFKKKQVGVIFITYLLAFLVARMTNFVLPRFNIFIPVTLGINQIIFGVGFAFAIIKYRFLTVSAAEAAENIIKIMPDALFLLDSSFRINRINQAVTMILGYKSDDLIGRKMEEILDEQSVYIMQELLEKKYLNNKQINFVAKDGKLIPAILSGIVIFDKENHSQFVLYSILTAKSIENLKKYAHDRLLEFAPILKKVSTGDFSEKIRVPQKTDEFTEHIIALNSMIDNLEKSTKELRITTAELKDKNEDLEKFNKAMVGRELEMVKLKERIKSLERKIEKQNTNSVG